MDISNDRVKALLSKLDTVRRSEQRKSRISDDVIKLSHKFMGQVHEIFQNLPKPLEWRSFYNNDLKLLVDTAPEVRKASIRHKLNKSQTRALEQLNRISKSQFETFVQESALSEKPGNRRDGPVAKKRRLRDDLGSDQVERHEIRMLTQEKGRFHLLNPPSYGSQRGI